LEGKVRDEVDQNEGLQSGSQTNQEENDESNTDTRSEGVPLDRNTNLSKEIIPQIVLKCTKKDHQILTEASDIIKLTPRVAKRIVSVSKLLKIVWYHRPLEGLSEQMKTEFQYATLILLAFSGKDFFRPHMRKFFEFINYSGNPPRDEATCLRDLLSHVSDDFKPEHSNVDTSQKTEKQVILQIVNKYLNRDANPLKKVKVKSSINDDGMEWRVLKRAMRSVRSFSFVGDVGEMSADSE